MPNNYMIAMKLLAIAAICAGCVLFGTHLMQPKIAALNQTIGALQTSNSQLELAAQAQNDGIAKLVASTKEREIAASKAIDSAKRLAESSLAKAKKLLAEQHPSTGNVCAQASSEFDSELLQDRTK